MLKDLPFRGVPVTVAVISFILFLMQIPKISYATGSQFKPPLIQEVIVDFDTESIQIMGINLKYKNKKPKVFLGEFGQLNVITSTADLVVADFPTQGLPDGEYLLTIITEQGKQNDEFDLTVDSAGGSGEQGPPGPQGPAGPSGPQGPQGLQGEQGLQGPAGPQGDQGPPGESGDDGLPTLLRKSDEPEGDNCANGGTKVETGLDMDNSLSLDDPEVTNTYYVCNGEAGPEGPQGPVGPTGATGPAGPQGEKGPAGPQGSQGPAGTDGAQGPQGLQGDVGPQGPQGPAGIDGLAGLNGLDGISCWDLNSNNTCDLPDEDSNEDTFCTPVDCQGPQGEQGEVGPEGAQGLQGPQGPAGNDGAQGTAGPQGPPGPQGDVGPQGPPGPQGPQGPQGEQGPPGEPADLQDIVSALGLEVCEDNEVNVWNGTEFICKDINLIIAAGQPIASCLDALNQGNTTSGLYNIDPDGASGSPAFQVYCDMTTDGGGWTLIYKAPNSNLSSPNPQYDVNNSNLLTSATETLIGYVNSTNTLGSPRARFVIPSNWRTAHPLSYSVQDQSVNVSIDGASQVSSLLRYGNQGFGSSCNDSWGGSPRGRLCLQGTSGPFYSDFNVGSQDFCSASNQSFNAQACDNSNRIFAIFIR